MIISRTYKLRSPGISDHAGYFTIAGDPIKAFFLNSREMQSFQWITGIMTAWSRQLKAGVPIEDLIQDMKETFDPKGSYIIPDGSGREVQSVVHHLGLILEEHIKQVNKEHDNANLKTAINKLWAFLTSVPEWE